MVIELVREAAKSLARGDTARAVDKLVGAWLELRSPRIARLAALAAARLPIDTLPSKIAEREAAWLALAAKADRNDLPTLLAAEWPVHPRAAKARLAPLLGFEPDPRISVALRALWESDRYLSSAGIAFWRSALRTLVKWGDPTASEMIAAARRADAGNKSYVVRAFAKTRLPASPPLDAALDRELASLEAALGTSPTAVSLDELFDAVYAEPASDAPRMVLADALLSAGDPRGEFIQLQLAKQTAKVESRIKSLLRSYEKTWQGGLEGIIAEPIFKRGFVTEAFVGDDGRYQAELRAWRTLETIRFRRAPKQKAWQAVAAFLAHENLAGVRHIEHLPIAAIDSVSRSLDRELASLGVVTPYAPVKSRLRVRELAVSSTRFAQGDSTVEPLPLEALFAWCDALPFTPPRLVLDRFENDLAACWRWFSRTRVSRLVLKPRVGLGEPMAWELALDRDGGFVATWHGRLYGEREPAGLGDALAALPPDALTSIVITSAVKLDTALKQRFMAELAPAIERQTRVPRPSMFVPRPAAPV